MLLINQDSSKVRLEYFSYERFIDVFIVLFLKELKLVYHISNTTK